MNSSYIKALETRARWLKWSKEHAWEEAPFEARNIVPTYQSVLETDNVFFMNKNFCSLVDHARRGVPDDLKFDLSWILTKTGFLYLEEPFLCPDFVLRDELVAAARKKIPNPDTKIEIRISAIGWLPVGNITTLEDGRRYGEYGEGKGVALLCFHDLGGHGRRAPVFLDKHGKEVYHRSDGGFGMWSYFTFADEDTIIDRVRNFEEMAQKEGGAYADNRERDELHEIRWIYTALYLMAQRLAIQMKLPLDRATRRRALREGHPELEEIRIISLRKLEAARLKAQSEPHLVDWQWQWEVRGHWRNQFYRAANEHRPVFIEAYIKGPEDKPLKDPGQKLFAAVR